MKPDSLSFLTLITKLHVCQPSYPVPYTYYVRLVQLFWNLLLIFKGSEHCILIRGKQNKAPLIVKVFLRGMT